MDAKRVRTIIKEELRKVLKEEEYGMESASKQQSIPLPKKNTNTDVGKTTEQEMEWENLLTSARGWGDELTTVNYRQFLQNIQEDPIGKKMYPQIQAITSNVIRMRDRFNDIKQAANLADMYQGKFGQGIQRALVQSGYVYEPYQH